MQQLLSLYKYSKIFRFPPFYSVKANYSNNPISHLFRNSVEKKVTIEDFFERRTKGFRVTDQGSGEETLVLTQGDQVEEEFRFIIQCEDFRFEEKDEIVQLTNNYKWLKFENEKYQSFHSISEVERPDYIFNSWTNSFNFIEENYETGKRGLRKPQIGAIHAVHAHWSVSNDPATIVMPTGTGKTETMLSLLVSKPCSKLLLVVPSDALRTQTINKFITLGVLKNFGILSEEAFYPIVGMLKHRPGSIKEIDEYFSRCNVIVSTMSVVGQLPKELQERISFHCKYLFIDEAHHIGAPTWSNFKQRFNSSSIVQFTATPFREDGKSIEGKIIYNYPLKKAQAEGYFSEIKFTPVIEYQPLKKDKEIAKKAVAQLKKDISKGLSHILMARVNKIERAEEVFEIYKKYTEYNPVRIHNKLTSAEILQYKEDILSKKSRIVVCVDMLGEGFDLPELKIAAFHDIRKSLPITLQLIGRFTRARSDLGNPTCIANIADVEVKYELRGLYSKDPDWNSLLPEASSNAIGKEIELQQYLGGFFNFSTEGLNKEISLQNLKPAMSVVVYRTFCEQWTPENYMDAYPNPSLYESIRSKTNPQSNSLVIIKNRKVKNDWAKGEEFYTIEWELLVLYWSKEQNLLFIHGSNNNGFYKELAEAVVGSSVSQISGSNVFRCFYDINRLKLQNVGLSEAAGRMIRYTMRAGSDIEPALTPAQRRNTTKSNMYGMGYEKGKKVTLGCSYKGRIWARMNSDLLELKTWCDSLGKKLLNESIDPEEILNGTLKVVEIDSRPDLMPIAIDWPDKIYKHSETNYKLTVCDNTIYLYMTDLALVNPSKEGNICFAIESEGFYTEFELKPSNENYSNHFSIVNKSPDKIMISGGSTNEAIESFFYKDPPIIYFAEGSTLRGNEFVELRKQYPPYPVEKIEVWDWTGVDITRESQGIEKLRNSIQYRVISELKKGSYDIIFDDDDSGEIADVVTITDGVEAIFVELYHCKFSSRPEPGERIKDLYEVCGQAQKSIHWVDKLPNEFFEHMMRRDPRRRNGQEFSRLEKGDKEILYTVIENSRYKEVHYKINIVQPGLSRSMATINQLELLSVTENYLMETYQVPFTVIASD